MRFSQEPAASALLRGLKIHARYVFNCAPRGRERALKAKSSDRRGWDFPVLQGGRTRKYQAYFKGRQHGKARQFIPLHRVVLWLYCLTIKSICRRESRVTLKAPYLRFSKPLRRFSTCLGAALLTHFLIHTMLIHNNMPLFLPWKN